MCAIECAFVPLIDVSIQGPIFNILVACDHEFIPSLSSRGTALDRAFGCVADESAPLRYMEDIKSQSTIVAYIDGKISGFMSFRHAVRIPELGTNLPVNYITTICTLPQYRGVGVATKMYDLILTALPPEVRCPATGTRTWSLNETHLRLLDRLGFELTKRIPNDRGKGIDTVYFVRQDDEAMSAQSPR